jgi:hypothetical protein
VAASGDHFQVKSADLVVHAGHVDSAGDALAAARSAGDAVRMGVAAYGQLCPIVPALLDGLQARLINGIRSAEDAAGDTADALRSVAASYDSADDNAVDRLRSTR